MFTTILLDSENKMEYQADVKTLLGEEMYGKLKGAADADKIKEKKAALFAFHLDPKVGGSFANSRDRPDFKYDGDAFMLILGDYFRI